MDASDYAAWYGALIATTVLVWDVIKWKSAGPVIVGDAHAGWESYGIQQTEGLALTTVRLTNNGGRPTTLVSWGMYWYPAGASLDDKKARHAFLVQGGLAGTGKVPCKIESGDVWNGLIKENEKFHRMQREGTLVFGFGFSHQVEEVLVKIEAS